MWSVESLCSLRTPISRGLPRLQEDIELQPSAPEDSSPWHPTWRDCYSPAQQPNWTKTEWAPPRSVVGPANMGGHKTERKNLQINTTQGHKESVSNLAATAQEYCNPTDTGTRNTLAIAHCTYLQTAIGIKIQNLCYARVRLNQQDRCWCLEVEQKTWTPGWPNFKSNRGLGQILPQRQTQS